MVRVFRRGETDDGAFDYTQGRIIVDDGRMDMPCACAYAHFYRTGFPDSTGIKQRILIFTDRLTCACATHIVPEGKASKTT